MKGDALSQFQGVLLETLYRHQHADAILAALRAEPACEPYSDYIDSMEPRMLEVAAELVKKWGVRDDRTLPEPFGSMPH